MEEQHLSPLAITHLLQHTLRSLCNSQWVYAVFWRILPRNYPPPKWDGQGAYDRSRGNRRNWILVWEDGFCNFAASSSAAAETMNEAASSASASASASASEFQQHYHHHHDQVLQPELFFKMSHEIYNYGEGLIGKVAADHSHKWIYKEPNEQEINFLSTWHNSADSQPRTWEAQFQSGIKTIALIAVREGVVQLGAVHKVVEDLSYVVTLRKKFGYIESIPGVLLPHPSSSSSSSSTPLRMDAYGYPMLPPPPHHHHEAAAYYQLTGGAPAIPPPPELYDAGAHHHHMMMNNNNHGQPPFKIAPSMSSLEALLSKLPSVVPPQHEFMVGVGMEAVAAKEEEETTTEGGRHHDHDHDHDHDQYDGRSYTTRHQVGESSSSMTSSGHGKSSHRHHHHHHHHHQFHLHHHDLNVDCSTPNSGYFE